MTDYKAVAVQAQDAFDAEHNVVRQRIAQEGHDQADQCGGRCLGLARDKRAFAARALQQALIDEQLQGLAHRAARQAVPLCQRELRHDLIAGLKRSLFNLAS
jgi:hypothetical protein